MDALQRLLDGRGFTSQVALDALLHYPALLALRTMSIVTTTKGATTSSSNCSPIRAGQIRTLMSWIGCGRVVGEAGGHETVLMMSARVKGTRCTDHGFT